VKVILLLVAGATAVYAALLIVLFLLQVRILFPGAGPAPLLPATAERLSVTTPGGEQLRGVHLRPDPEARTDGLLILGFGGNAWNADAAALTLHDLYPESDVVTFHFRGYPPSGGNPAASALLDDAPLLLDYVVRHYPDRRFIVTGFSVGTAPAARLTANGHVAGVLFVTPFDSLRSVVHAHFPWAPVGLLLRERLEPIEDIRRTKVPVAIIAAQRDEIVPRSSTQALVHATPNLVLERVIPDSDHNGVYGHPAFMRAMREARDAIRSAMPPS
jgi:pimeloyl-ACP methyl ester carboxylesterase